MNASLETLPFRPCFVMPVYNHREAVGRMVERLASQGLVAFLVDDGSDDGSTEVLLSLAEKYSWVRLVRRKENGGKGAAVFDGMRAALNEGFTHAIQIDADGQHDVEVVPEFLRLGERFPRSLILGRPKFSADAPKVRVWGREISNFLVRLESLRLFSSRAPIDVLCGFRLYPIALYDAIYRETAAASPGMDFDTDIIVRLCWEGIELEHVETRVSYPEDGVSHFRYLRDNLKLIRLHVRLLFGALRRVPRVFGSTGTFSLHSPASVLWARLPERGSNFWVRFLFFFCRSFGRVASGFLLRPVILYFILTGGKARKGSEKYLRRVFGLSPDARVPFARVYKHFLNFGLGLIDKVGVWTNQFTFQECRWHGKEDVRTRIDRGEGVIMMSAHFGNIEIGRAIAEDLPRLKINALMYTEHATKYHEFLRHHSEDSHLRIIPMSSASPVLIEQLRGMLHAGECIGMLGDRVTPGSPEKTVEVNFFGEPAAFPAGPFILAALLQAPVYLAFSIRAEDGTYDIYFELFAEKVVLARGMRDEHLRSTVQRYADRLEFFCRKAPYQWFNFYDFWKIDTKAKEAPRVARGG